MAMIQSLAAVTEKLMNGRAHVVQRCSNTPRETGFNKITPQYFSLSKVLFLDVNAKRKNIIK